MGDIIGKRFHDHIAVAFQSPTALNVTALSVGKSKREWTCLARRTDGCSRSDL